MAYIPEGFGEAVFQWTLVGDSEPINVTMGFKNPAGGALADLQEAATSLESHWFDNMMGGVAGGINTSYTYLGLKASIRPTGAPTPDQFEVPNITVGTAGAAPPPQNCAMLVRRGTAGFGRKNKGRFYLPFYGESETQVSAAGDLSPAAIAVYQPALDGFLSGVESSLNCDIYLLHGYRVTDPGPPPVYGPPAEAPALITSLTLQPKIATQRRRLRP